MEEKAKRRPGPWPRFLIGLVVGVSLGVGIIFLSGHAGGKAGYLARRASCKSNLSEISRSIATYQADHQERYPLDPGAMAAEGNVPGFFVCPSVPREKTDWPQEPGRLREAVNRDTDYIYVPSSGDVGAEVLTAFDLPANHQQVVVNALFADFRVEEILLPDAFMAGVQKTNDVLAAERGIKP